MKWIHKFTSIHNIFTVGLHMWMCIVSISNKGCRGCDRMVVEFITTNVISAYRCSNPAQARCTRYNTPVSYTTKTVRHDIAEILLKVALNTITLTQI